MEKPKITIIGAGPAGIAASIQLKRFGYEPQIFEMDRIGGLLWNANLVENYPGFPMGISGPDLINLMEKQLKHLEIEVTRMEITNLTFVDDHFHLTSGNSNFISEFVVVASGTKPKENDLIITESAKKFIHQDIKKILNVNGKHIVIIGCGDAAFDQAINLSKRNRITILYRGTDIKALKILAVRASTNKKITLSSNTTVEYIDYVESKSPIKGQGLLLHLKTDGGKIITFECDEIVFALGRDPQLDFFGQIIDSDKIFLVGDVINGVFRQATIAIGNGIMAAMKINNKILLR